MSKRKNQKKWASDEVADSLLAGILSETEDAAIEEQARMDAELAAREAEVVRDAEAAAAKRRDEANAKIAAENRRQDAISARRTQKMHALRGVEVQHVEQEPPPKPVIEEPAPTPARSIEVPLVVDEEPVHLPRRSRSVALAIASAALVAATVGAGLLAQTMGSYTPDAQVYAKAVYAPKDLRDALVEKASIALPETVEALQPEKRTVVRERVRPKATSPSPAVRPDRVGVRANERASRLQELLKNSSDPFGLESK